MPPFPAPDHANGVVAALGRACEAALQRWD